jgi:hypothetical protein
MPTIWRGTPDQVERRTKLVSQRIPARKIHFRQGFADDRDVGLDITSRWSNSRPAKSEIPMVRK